MHIISRGGSRTAATSKMESFVIIINGWKLLTIITKSSILDVAVVLDLPFTSHRTVPIAIWQIFFWASHIWNLQALFYKQRFFLTQPQCCLTFQRTEPQMLLKYCLLHRGIALPRHAIFCIFFSLSTSWSIYVLFMWSVFSLSFSFSLQLII